MKAQLLLAACWLAVGLAAPDELQAAASAVIDGKSHLRRAASLAARERQLAASLERTQQDLAAEMDADARDNARAEELLATRRREIADALRSADTQVDASQRAAVVGRAEDLARDVDVVSDNLHRLESALEVTKRTGRSVARDVGGAIQPAAAAMEATGDEDWVQSTWPSYRGSLV